MKINEIFHSIQGEGLQIGIPTIFIRTSGCNLRCIWCDTKYAYSEGEDMEVAQIMKEITRFSLKHVCITGGEPLLQDDLNKLVQELDKENYSICLETNGSLSIEKLPSLDNLMISLDIKCPSSEMHEKNDLSNLQRLGTRDQLKFIINDERDYEYAKKIIADHKPICSVIMIPQGGRDLKTLAEWILKDKLDVRPLPQLHKLIWGEKRGV